MQLCKFISQAPVVIDMIIFFCFFRLTNSITMAFELYPQQPIEIKTNVPVGSQNHLKNGLIQMPQILAR